MAIISGKETKTSVKFDRMKIRFYFKGKLRFRSERHYPRLVYSVEKVEMVKRLEQALDTLIGEVLLKKSYKGLIVLTKKKSDREQD